MMPGSHGAAPELSSAAGLTPEQRRAVERTGQDVCVVAGPGSGKTRVLTERFAWLIEQAGVDASRILAITFTDKAAIEIKTRLIKRFASQPERREQIERAWVSTTDGFCARLLRDNAITAGLSPEFTILEAAPAEQLQREAAEHALDQLLEERPKEFRRLLESLDLSTQDNGSQPDLCAGLLAIYESMRVSGATQIAAARPCADGGPRVAELVQEVLREPPEGTDNQRAIAGALREWAKQMQGLAAGVTPRHFEVLNSIKGIHVGRLKRDSRLKALGETLRDELQPALEAQWLSLWYGDLHELMREALRRIDATYRARKRKLAALDFADLGEFTIQLLEANDGLRRQTAARFDQVLMDELQDTNRLQWRLIRLLCGGQNKLFAVGDINQSIYGFRHADPDVFAEYRSGLRQQGLEIDELADNYRSRPEILDAVARMLDGQPGIEPRVLQSRGDFAPHSGPSVERLMGQDPDSSDKAQQAEAALVAGRIREWVDAGTHSFSDIAVLCRTYGAMEAFEQAFDRHGIPFLVSGGRGFLEARETRDLLALLAALVNPLDEIPLLGVLRGPLFGFSDEALYRMGREGWVREFEHRFGTARRRMGFVAPDRLLAQALDQAGYCALLPERARANVEKLLGWLRREHYNRPRPLAELLQDLEALRKSESVAEAPPPEAGNIVSMMTIHAAKGLEFPVVFLAGVHRGGERRKPVILFSEAVGLGARWRHPVTGNGASDHVHAFLSEELKRRDAAEEHRLLYVGLTRAMDRLVVSHAERKPASPWAKLAAIGIPDVTSAAAHDIPPLSLQEAENKAVASGSVTEIAAPVGADQYDASASMTSVAMFAACPRRYYLERYLGLESKASGPTEIPAGPAASGRGGAELGLEVHRILAGDAENAGAYSGVAMRMASTFQNSELGQRVAKAARVEREFDFMFELDGVILQGQIDLWFQDEQGVVLVDYKTDRDDSQAAAYGLQLQLYAMALAGYAGQRPNRAVLSYLRTGQEIDVSLAAEDLVAAQAKVSALRQAQATQAFPAQPGDQCRKCGFHADVCPVNIMSKTQAGVHSPQ